jgi:hypothetical protein
MKVEIKEETYRFLKNLAFEMGNQDNRATANPRYYSIEEDEEICGLDPGYTDEWAWRDDDGNMYNTDEAIGLAKEVYYDGNEDAYNADVQLYSIAEIVKNAGLERVGIGHREKYSNVFFTEKGIRRHIEANHYHYKNPRDFLFHAFRNPEMEGVINAIMEIGEADIEQ